MYNRNFNLNFALLAWQKLQAKTHTDLLSKTDSWFDSPTSHFFFVLFPVKGNNLVYYILIRAPTF